MKSMNRPGIDATMIMEAAGGDLAAMGKLLGRLEPEAYSMAYSVMKQFSLDYDYHSTQDIAQGIMIDLSRYIQEDFCTFWEHYRANMDNKEGR